LAAERGERLLLRKELEAQSRLLQELLSRDAASARHFQSLEDRLIVRGIFFSFSCSVWLD
jgi:hypothetical protein